MGPLQCHMQAFNANIISVDAYSANDLSDKHAPLGASGYFADVTLTGKYHQDVFDARHWLTMRHSGTDCRNVKGTDSKVCNIDYVENQPGNSCAQVTQRSHLLGWSSGKALDISATAPNAPVHFRASLAPSLQTWWTGLPNTCAVQRYNAPHNPYKIVTLTASGMHTWTKLVIMLDAPEPSFFKSWSCEYNDSLSPVVGNIQVSEDGKTYTLTNVKYQPILYSANEENKSLEHHHHHH
uniref:Llp1 n=1 Tax=Mycosarcoma maydis TaxID=5270 RepID=UPI003F8D8FD0